MADGRNDGNTAHGYGPAELFVAPGQQGGRISTPAGQDDEFHVLLAGKPVESLDDREGRAGTAHGRLRHLERVTGEPCRDHRFDVFAHRGISPAQNTDDLRQAGHRPSRSIEKAVGCQPRPDFGHHGRYRAFAYRRYFLRLEDQLSPVVAPYEGAKDQHSLPAYSPAPARVAGRADDRHLGGTVPQGEKGPAAARLLGPVHFTLDSYAADTGQRTCDLA